MNILPYFETMSYKHFIVASSVSAASAARLTHSNDLLSARVNAVDHEDEDPLNFFASLNGSLLETDQSWFWRRGGRGGGGGGGGSVVNAPIGGTSPAWAGFRPSILAIEGGSDRLGKVSSVFTFGAPASAKKPLTDDNRADGCFDGYRTFYGENDARDPVSWLAYAGGFKHALMKAMTLYSGQPPWLLPCSEATTTFPPSDGALAIALHFTSGYLKTAQEEMPQLPPHLETHARLMRSCYVDHAEAADLGRPVGYRFVAEAANGDDLTRLFQHTDTLDCIISFRGSDNAGDWINNAGVGSRNFCNFEDVHSGFVSKFTNTVTASQFQTNIRAKFPMCASVQATGHSLGGAVAEMFAGCINRGSTGLTPLEDLPRGTGITTEHRGWMEYYSFRGQIVWFRGTPELMPEFTP